MSPPKAKGTGAPAPVLVVERRPEPTRSGAVWLCNACPAQSVSVKGALAHVRGAETQCDHFMHEHEAGERHGRRFRRVRVIDGRAVVERQKRGSGGPAGA